MAKFQNKVFLLVPSLVTSEPRIWNGEGEMGLGMGMGALRGGGGLRAAMAALANAATATTHDSNASFMRGQFRCPVAPVKSVDECVNRTTNGYCPDTSQCFSSKASVRQTGYWMCCCDKLQTSVMQAINHSWSCTILERLDPSGGQPFCDVLCCVPSGTEGTKCTWLEQQRWGWHFVRPGSSSRTCCVGFDGTSCQSTCSFPALPCCVSSLVTAMVVAAIIHRRHETLWEKPLRIRTGLLCTQAAVAWKMARHVGHSELESGLWVLLTCAPQPLHYGILRLRKSRRQTHERQDPARLAVMLIIETYTSGAYPSVADHGKDTLAARLEDMGWEVRIYSTGEVADFESARDLVQAQLKGTTNSEVLLYVSCHSVMEGDVPIILQSDAGKYTGWFRSKSLYTMLREFKPASAENAKFIVFFNGCLVPPHCKPWWHFIFCACRWRGDLRSLQMGSTDVTICYSCTPGQQAFVQNSLSRALVEALREGAGRRPIFNIFESLRRILGAGRPSQTPIIIGTECQIVLDRSEEAG